MRPFDIFFFNESPPPKVDCAGVYLLVNLENNKAYVGESIRLWERIFYDHTNEFENILNKRKDTNENCHLTNAIKKYGIENFCVVILEILPKNKDITLEREEYYRELWHLRNKKFGYNILPKGGLSSYKRTPEVTARLQATQRRNREKTAKPITLVPPSGGTVTKLFINDFVPLINSDPGSVWRLIIKKDINSLKGWTRLDPINNPNNEPFKGKKIVGFTSESGRKARQLQLAIHSQR